MFPENLFESLLVNLVREIHPGWHGLPLLFREGIGMFNFSERNSWKVIFI
jgi:hypothetical protein